jgi:hypothetical protein
LRGMSRALLNRPRLLPRLRTALAQILIENYCQARPVNDGRHRTEETDRVSARIAQNLAEMMFSFSPAEYMPDIRGTFAMR